MDFCVVAIGGRAFNGKTTIRDIVKGLICKPLVVEHKSFAAPLKKIAEEIFDWDGDKEMYYKETQTFKADYLGSFSQQSQSKELIQDQGRQLLINIGMKFREIRPKIWAEYTARQIIKDIKNNEANNKIYIIDDMRFKNELDVLSLFGAKLLKIKVVRDNAKIIDDLSENNLDAYPYHDILIENNGDIYELTEKCKNLIIPAINEKLYKRIHC